jgi:hypothetical protein
VNPESTQHQHRMTIYNLDFVIDWIFENDQVRIIEVHLLHNNYPDLLKIISKKMFKMIVEDIENHELKRKWMD